MASLLLGTLGSLGQSLLGDLFSKGIKTVGNIAASKLDDIENKFTKKDQPD